MNVTPEQLAMYVGIDSVHYINLVVADSTDVRSVADALSAVLPNAVHVGLGGQVSQGRNADVLPDEVFDPSVPTTVVVEIYPGYSPTLLAQYLQFVLDTKLPDGTTVIFISQRKPPKNGHSYERFESPWLFPTPIANKMLNFGITLEAELA